jgi:hypothetical protein
VLWWYSPHIYKYIKRITWLTVTEYLCHKWTQIRGDAPLDANSSLSFPHSWLITGFVTRLTRRASLVEQELLTLPEHLSSPTVINEVCVTRSLVFCVMFCRSLFILLSFSVWSLCCLSFFELRIMITPLVPSNSSHRNQRALSKKLCNQPLQFEIHTKSHLFRWQTEVQTFEKVHALPINSQMISDVYLLHTNRIIFWCVNYVIR